MSLDFVSPETLANLSNLSQTQCDALPHGAVKVDTNGNILLYNDYEANMAGLDKTSVLGRNFFTEVAPCTNNRLFFGKFKTGVSEGHLQLKMPYTFTYKMRPTNVLIHMLVDKDSGTNWIFVLKR